ncbi:hypothetical protein GCM10028811_12240 [Uliginosibacterium sediminicola]
MKEARTAYNSNDGAFLIGSPKTKADGGMYFVYAYLDRPTGELELRGRLDSADTGKPGIEYFSAKIPEQFKAAFANAQVGSIIGIVGRYVANQEYKTVLGQEKLMPVFEAVYFELNPKTPRQEQLEEEAEARERDYQRQIKEKEDAIKAERLSQQSDAAGAAQDAPAAR